METSLLEELRKQNKISEFFSLWQGREFVSYPGEKQLIADLQRIADGLGMKDGLILGCFDYRDMSLAFFTENIEQLSGYSVDFLRQNGLVGVISALHPQDAKAHAEFNNKILREFERASLTEKRTFEASYTLRWLHKYTQEEIWFFVKAKPYFIDEDGNFILDLHIGLKVTNNESLMEYDWSFSYTKDNGRKVSFKKENLVRSVMYLTKKEKEVAKWLLEGFDSYEIADKMHISVNTVFVHRKNLLKKLNAKSSVELAKLLTMQDLM
jgi:DNA-binding CsgD family transcriptional regulator